jgi:UPF0148 protein
MSKDLLQKAAKMVINGATILSEPCPYCKGVRIMKDGDALCINCGKKPNKKSTKTKTKEKKSNVTLNTLEKKLEKLSYEKEDNPTKQQELIKTIDALIGIISKLRKK